MATQSVADLEKLPQAVKDGLGDAILANSAAHVVFAPSELTSSPTVNPGLEALLKLHGRQVALLSQDELELLRLFMDQGRKKGVSVEFDTDANADGQALAEMNSVSALEILAAANSYIRVHVSALEILDAANHEGTPQ